MGNTIETVSEGDDSYDTTQPDTDLRRMRSQMPGDAVNNGDGHQINDSGKNDGYGDGGSVTGTTVRRRTRGQRRMRTTDGRTTGSPVADGGDVPLKTGGRRRQVMQQRRRRRRSSQRRQRSSQRRPRADDEYDADDDYDARSTDSDRSNHVTFLSDVEQPPMAAVSEATTTVRRRGRKPKRRKTDGGHKK